MSTRAAVANTGVHTQVVYRHFISAITCFILSASLLIWLFAGLPARRHAEKNVTGGDGDGVQPLDSGENTIVCLNTISADDNRLRDQYMLVLSGATTGLIIALASSGYYTYVKIRATAG